MYAEDLKVGGNYSKLKRCISISILDYNLTDRPIYHSIYRLRDEYGNEFSNLLELHIIELRKQLNGEDYNLDNWIRFFNAESKEDLDMIQTKNTGLQEAIRQLKEMNLPKQLRLLHEARLKAKRDRWAQDEYVRQQGFMQGQEQGYIKGQELEREKNMQLLIPILLQSNTSLDEIVQRLEQHFSINHEEALKYYEKYKTGVY